MVCSVEFFQLIDIFQSPRLFQKGELGKEILLSLPEKITELAAFEDRIFAGVPLLVNKRVAQVRQCVYSREMVGGDSLSGFFQGVKPVGREQECCQNKQGQGGITDNQFL